MALRRKPSSAANDAASVQSLRENIFVIGSFTATSSIASLRVQARRVHGSSYHLPPLFALRVLSTSESTHLMASERRKAAPKSSTISKKTERAEEKAAVQRQKSNSQYEAFVAKRRTGRSRSFIFGGFMVVVLILLAQALFLPPASPSADALGGGADSAASNAPSFPGGKAQADGAQIPNASATDSSRAKRDGAEPTRAKPQGAARGFLGGLGAKVKGVFRRNK